MYKKIEQLCKVKGITPYRLAKDIGIREQVLYALKTRDGNLSFKNAVKVADYFGIELTELASK